MSDDASGTFAVAATRTGRDVLFTVTHTNLDGKYLSVEVDQTDELYAQLIQLVQGLAVSGKAQLGVN